MRLELFMPEYLSPGLNQWQRMHWRVRKRENESAIGHLLAAIGNMPIEQYVDAGELDTPLSVTYRRCRRKGRDMDEDNLTASFKPIGDAMQHVGLVSDDSEIRLTCEQECVGYCDGWGTVLIIEGAGG